MSEITDPTGQKRAKPRGKPFAKGESGNPAGRPKGTRNNLSKAFIEALHADFSEHGKKAIERVRLEKPEEYIKTVARLVPTQFQQVDDEGNDKPIEREMVITLVPSTNAFAENG